MREPYPDGLDCFTSIDDAAAEVLAQLKTPSNYLVDSADELRWLVLALNGLTSLSAASAMALAQHKGEELSFQGLTTLSDDAAEALAQHKGRLYLNGVKKLSAAAAMALARHEGDLYLAGLTSLSDDAALSLARHKDDICFGGLTGLSPIAARSLADRMRLTERIAQKSLDRKWRCRVYVAGTIISESNPSSDFRQFTSMEDTAAEVLASGKRSKGYTPPVRAGLCREFLPRLSRPRSPGLDRRVGAREQSWDQSLPAGELGVRVGRL